MKRSTRQRLRLSAVMIGVSGILGACYGLSQKTGESAVWPLAARGVIGMMISSSIIGIELLAAGYWACLRQFPVVITFLGRTVASAAIIALAMLVFPWLLFDAPLNVTREGFASSIVSALWMTFVLSTATTVV